MIAHHPNPANINITTAKIICLASAIPSATLCSFVFMIKTVASIFFNSSSITDNFINSCTSFFYIQTFISAIVFAIAAINYTASIGQPKKRPTYSRLV